MDEKIYKLVVGGLLHDIGKVIYRTGKGKYHGYLGADYLQEQIGIKDEEILTQIRLHHKGRLQKEKVANNDLAYITYIADNISSGADRRNFVEGVEPELKEHKNKFHRAYALQSIFNVFNNNVKKLEFGMEYEPTKKISKDKVIKTSENEKYSYDFYLDILNSVGDELKKMKKWNEDYINSVLSITEKYFSFIPCSILKYNVEDISLYDHSKLTAAFGCCIYKFLENKDDYRFLLEQDEEFYKVNAFLYYTFDISGIQNFIYTIHSDGALKNLRARSFYLEIFVEHIVDEILLKLGLSRANLLYTGGGHAQFVLPNTSETKRILNEVAEEVNHWLRNNFDIKLYFADAYCECAASDFMEGGNASFHNKLSIMQDELTKKKYQRYSAKELADLNNNHVEGARECKVCHRSSNLGDGDECDLCRAFREISRELLDPQTTEKTKSTEAFWDRWENKELFLITKNCVSKKQLPLPFNCYLSFVTKEEFKEKYQNGNDYVRVYTKNDIYIGCRMETHLWVGDYNRYNTLEETADHASGIRRIGVLRADVDNLSDAFIRGFEEKYDTLSRKTVLSSGLSLFFKFYINYFLLHGHEKMIDKENKRAITIVYSGGDDVFVIGSWDDVVGFAIDLHNEFDSFTQKKLTLSAGIGIYPPKYPISRLAYEVGELEECAKDNGKDSVTLFDGKYTFKWNTFIQDIYQTKYKLIKGFFGDEENARGNSFLYHLLDWLKGIEACEGKDINLARYAFLLARLEPGDKEPEKKKKYQDFAMKMYQWTQDKEDVRKTIVAIYIYLYAARVRKDDKNGK